MVIDLLEAGKSRPNDWNSFCSKSSHSNSKIRSHSVKENAMKGVYIDSLTERTTMTSHEAYLVFFEGLKHKKVSGTMKNRESSRSHTIFQLKLYKPGTDKVISKLSLIDLAGSERLQEFEASCLERIEESKNINKSLSALGNVIYQLKHSNGKHKNYIAYRDSKLTHILKDSLGGNSFTNIIITLSPSQLFL